LRLEPHDTAVTCALQAHFAPVFCSLRTVVQFECCPTRAVQFESCWSELLPVRELPLRLETTPQ